MLSNKVDQEIEQDVQTELEWELGKAADEIGVKSHAGLVTLTGSSWSYATKLSAQEAAHRVAGVTDVANDIQVKVSQSNTRTDPEIARAVRSALEWDVLVPDDRIVSTVSQGFVTLEGSVESLLQRNDAEYVVRRLAGVRGVYNKINVLPQKVEPEDLQFKIEEALERRAVREAEHIRVNVEDGKVTLTGKVQSWDEKRAILGLVSHASGVKTVNDHLAIKGWR